MAYTHNAGGGMGDLIKYGLLAVAGYFIYQKFFTGTATPAIATPTPAAPAAPATPAAPTSAFNTLDAIYSRMVAAATADKAPATMTADQWNVYLKLSSNVSSPPDPPTVFPNQDRATLMSSAQYWAGMSQYLATTMGMSGLGSFGGLGFAMCGVRL